MSKKIVKRDSKKKKPKENMTNKFLCFIKEKPWYIWLSVPVFLIFPIISMAQSKLSDGSVFKCWWNITWIAWLVLLLPLYIIFMIIAQIILSTGISYFSLPSADFVGASIVMYLSIYVLGVLATCLHVDWRRKNIAPRQN